MNVDRYFLDTNILVYANDIHFPDKQNQARLLISHLVSSGHGCISTQVLAEFWVTVTRKLNPSLPDHLIRQQIALFDTFYI